MMVRLIGEGVSGGFFGGSSARASAQLASKAAMAMHVLDMVPLRLPQLSGGILAPRLPLRERAADAQSWRQAKGAATCRRPPTILPEKPSSSPARRAASAAPPRLFSPARAPMSFV